MNINRTPDERSTIPLEFIHTDLAGPIEETALGGFKYAMNFIDDFTGATFVYFLKQKSDATKALKKFLSDIAPYGKVKRMTPYGKTKRMRSDNGGEYIAEEYEETLIENQIRHETCAPYSPHQNGTAERSWRTLFNMARSMLIESGLPKKLWTYAVMAAAHIRNRVYNQRIQDTPYHKLTGKKPQLSKLHIFGTICFSNIHEKKKLDPRSQKGYFVGYDKYSPAYLIYYPRSNTVLKNATVSFTEKFEKEFNEKPTTQEQNELPDIFQGNQGELEEEEIIHEEINGDENQTIYKSKPTEADEDKSKEEKENKNETDDNHRSSTRKKIRPKHLEDYTCQMSDTCYKILSTEIPVTYADTLKSKDSAEWKDAMDSEMKSLVENEVYTVTTLPPGKKAIGSRWVYSVKKDPEGNTLHKARFVAKGYSQVQGSDYSETFAPTPKMSTIRMLMQISAENNLTVHQMDVKTAYLNAPIDCEVYLTQPEGFEVKQGDVKLVWRLHKSLYGLKQSGRNWNFVLCEFFSQQGYKQSKVDVCLFTKIEVKHMTMIIIWVDDIIIAASNKYALSNTKDELKRRFRMKDLGAISYFLGIQFRQEENLIEMNQSFYLRHVLERFNMADCKPRSTPCEIKLEAYEPTSNEYPFEHNTRKYREIIGSLVYAMTCTRPDLAWIITKLSQHLENPTEVDWMTTKHVLRYKKGSLDYKLVYKKSEKGLMCPSIFWLPNPPTGVPWAGSKNDVQLPGA